MNMILKLRLLTIILDYLILLPAFALAYFLRVGFIFSSDLPFASYWLTSLIASAVWVAALMIFRGYSMSIRLNRPLQILKILIAGLTSTAAFGLTFYFSEKAFFSRLLLLYIFLFGSMAMTCFHLLMQTIEYQLIRRGYGIVRLLIIGSNRGVKSFIVVLKRNTSRYIPVAILDGYGTRQKDILGVPVLGKLNILEKTVSEYHIDAIVQGDSIEHVITLVHFCEQKKLDYYLLPYLLGMLLKIQVLEQPVITTDKPASHNFWEKVIGP